MTTFKLPADVEQKITHRRGRLHQHAAFDPARTAFLVVDMQNYFLHESQQACCPAARDIVPNINAIARTLRDTGGQVVWIVTEATEEAETNWRNFYEGYSPEGADRRRKSLSPDDFGYQIWPELEVEPADTTVVKNRYSAFIQGASDIAARLRDRGIDTVLVGGTVTNVCCESTARDASMLGFRTIMIADANAANRPAEHEAALTGFIQYFGDVQTTAAILDLIRTQAQKSAAE